MRITRRQLRRIIRENLWDNIRKKRARGEKPAKPGDKDYPDAKAWKSATSESDDPLDEGVFDDAMKKLGMGAISLQGGDTEEIAAGYKDFYDAYVEKHGPDSSAAAKAMIAKDVASKGAKGSVDKLKGAIKNIFGDEEDPTNESLRITKSQLARLVYEAMDLSDREANPHDGGMYGEDIEDRQWDEAEYDRGYQDGFDGVPVAGDATTGYDAGYEDGSLDASKPQGRQGMAGETYEKTLADYKKHPEWFN